MVVMVEEEELEEEGGENFLSEIAALEAHALSAQQAQDQSLQSFPPSFSPYGHPLSGLAPPRSVRSGYTGITLQHNVSATPVVGFALSSPSQSYTGGVYVLELISGAFYAGKSERVESRLKQQMTPGCPHAAAWVKMHSGVFRSHETLVPSMASLELWEQQETIMRMLKHGFNKVSGWEFVRVGPLEPKDCETIKTLVFGLGDMCRKCGGIGYQAAKCGRRDKEAWLAELEDMIQSNTASAADCI